MTYFERAKIKYENLRTKETVRILSVESSCDETSVAIIENGRKILVNLVASQIEIHKRFGGVVPEIASRNHVTAISNLYRQALREANLKETDIDAVAVTYGAGLVGALLVGVNFAKALAFSLDVPLIAVSHIKGHIAANYLTHQSLNPPFVCLMVSGGHTAILNVTSYNSHELVGTTIDDAVGEAFDKVSRVLGLGYPGGPNVDRLAKLGQENIKFISHSPLGNTFNFSFSGIKTAVINYIHNEKQRGKELNIPNICASFQDEAVWQVVSKTVHAVKEFGYDKIVLAGGVSANGLLRSKMDEEAKKVGAKVYYPELKLCTDNAAMIASAGYYNYINNKSIVDPKTLVPTSTIAL